MESDPELQGFHDKFKALEQKIIDAGLDNSIAWFKKAIKSRDGVEEKFNPIIKESRDKETGEPDGRWPPSMKVKVPRRDGVWECKVVDKERKEFDINGTENPQNCEDLFVKNTRVRSILQCVGLWVASGNYMCQWKLVKAEVDVPEQFCSDDFLDDSDAEDNVEQDFVEDSDEGENTGDAEAAVADADDDDGADADEAEPEPEPEPEPVKPKKKVVKRVVRRKKTSDN